MDRIIELIIVFYLISAFLRFLKGGSKGKEGDHRPFPQPRPAPPPFPRREERPYPPPGRSYPTPRKPYPHPGEAHPRTEGAGSGQVLTTREREALDVLAGWEKRAQTQRGRAEAPKARQTTPYTVESQKILRPKPVPKPMPQPVPMTHHVPMDMTMPMAKEKTTPVEEHLESKSQDIYPLGHPEMLRQGIIMSEILRPPLARRGFSLFPYLRG